MRQIVKDILETESKIREILDQARQKASQMKLAAEKEACEQVGDAGQQARAIVQAEVEEARKKSQQIREETLARADRQERASLDEEKEAMEDLVARICAVVLNPDAVEKGESQKASGCRPEAGGPELPASVPSGLQSAASSLPRKPDLPFSEATECEMDDP